MKYVDDFIRRLLDVGAASLACVVLSPLMLLIAVAIRADDGSPIFFRQVRVGKGLRHFTILKFRTMKWDPAAAAQGGTAGSLAEKKAARAAFRTTVPGDSRITRVGRFLRSTHLDELPQLLNVLRGDMSLVGVRPDTPAQEVDYQDGYWEERHALRPGITGPAQVYANEGGLEERVTLERRWLSHPALGAYVRFLVATIGKVFRRSSF